MLLPGRVHTEGTIRVIEACLDVGVDALVYTSSGRCCGVNPGVNPGAIPRCEPRYMLEWLRLAWRAVCRRALLL
jgi:hypothetical protein